MSADSQFIVAPGLGAILWLVFVLAVIAAAIATALKGRWVWLAVGIVLGGLPLLYSAFLAPEPESIWARRAARRRAAA